MNKLRLQAIQRLLERKSNKNTYCTYPIVAIGINKSGDILGTASNKVNNCAQAKKGNGKHAERELIRKFGRSLKTILLYRKGLNGSCLPIHPCKVCKKILDKNNIKVISIYDIN